MGANAIGIENDFECANPGGPGGVERIGPDEFLIRPWSEDGDGNYKFRLDVAAVNGSGTTARLRLRIDWEDREYMDCRDYVLIGRGAEWRWVPAAVEGSVVSATADVPPGRWNICMHPTYDFESLAADRRRAREAGFSEEVFGKSFEGRDMVALSAGRTGAPVIFVVSRFHPYETAGTHAISGMIEALAADLAKGGPLTSAFRFVIVPIANPDGVAGGCCKRSRAGGPDLCHEGADSPDPAGRALVGLLARLRPRGYLDLHGWMHRDDDGLAYSDEEARDEFLAEIGGDPLFNKAWKGRCISGGPPRPGDFCRRAHADHGAVAFIMSPSWFGRDVPKVREFGRRVLSAFASVLRRRV
ncbi:MAG: M14 family zinc carboxypeptidase [Planctomycetota bacterium]|nr:M14 family zinc carboxypeptidase [Planctomycetota bacterium]